MKKDLQEARKYSLPKDVQLEIGDIIATAILDGQNQIHDLKDGKAIGEEVEERMKKSYDYHFEKMKKLVLAVHIVAVAEERERARLICESQMQDTKSNTDVLALACNVARAFIRDEILSPNSKEES